jgi:hypothetical protein
MSTEEQLRQEIESLSRIIAAFKKHFWDQKVEHETEASFEGGGILCDSLRADGDYCCSCGAEEWNDDMDFIVERCVEAGQI